MQLLLLLPIRHILLHHDEEVDEVEVVVEDELQLLQKIFVQMVINHEMPMMVVVMIPTKMVKKQRR